MSRDFTDVDLDAFLDGELDETTQDELETRIATDAVLADRLRRMRGAWAMLDYLEPVPATDDFTKSTITMAAIQTRRSGISRWVRRHWRTAAGLMVVSLIGFGLVYLPYHLHQQRLLRDIPVIVNMDLYGNIDTIAFVRQLDDAGLFAQEQELLNETEHVETVFHAEAADLQLKPDELAEVQRKRERFEQRKPTDQAKLRQLHADLMAQSDHDRLYGLITRYNQWHKTLSSKQKAELFSLESADRISQISELRAEQERLRFVEFSDESKMDPEDATKILTWLNEFIANHSQEILAQIPVEHHKYLKSPRHLNRAVFFLVSRGKVDIPPPTNEEFDELTRRVSNEMAVKLSELELKSRADFVELWMRRRAESARPPGPSHEELMTFFREKLTAEERERIERLPIEEMKDNLRGLYFQKRFSRDGSPSHRHGDEQESGRQ